ncbi:hypothetical protein NC653_039304 [Populus alba x Populus x berolinensis]|nr:hypothetical protein NC653_039304 [Populus alba x Populus x berolinensis]
MDVGQVGFHNSKMVRTVRVEKRLNEVVNRLNKTKVERKPDLKAEREAVNAAERAEKKLLLRDKLTLLLSLHKVQSLLGSSSGFLLVAVVYHLKLCSQGLHLNSGFCNKRREEMERLEKERQTEIRSYKGLMVAEKMTSNKQIASENKSLQELEDDFM